MQYVRVYVGDRIVRNIEVDTDDPVTAENAALARINDQLYAKAQDTPFANPDECINTDGGVERSLLSQ